MIEEMKVTDGLKEEAAPAGQCQTNRSFFFSCQTEWKPSDSVWRKISCIAVGALLGVSATVLMGLSDTSCCFAIISIPIFPPSFLSFFYLFLFCTFVSSFSLPNPSVITSFCCRFMSAHHFCPDLFSLLPFFLLNYIIKDTVQYTTRYILF